MANEPTAEEIENYQNKVLQETKSELHKDGGTFGVYNPIVKKMQNFLRIAGEKTSKKTHELFREHIPVSVFGVSSDEIATDLGMTESDFLQKIIPDNISSPSLASSRIKLPKTPKLYGVFRFLSPSYHEIVKEWQEKIKNKTSFYSVDLFPLAPYDLINQYYQYLIDKTKKDWKKRVYQTELDLLLKRNNVYLPFLLKLKLN